MTVTALEKQKTKKKLYKKFICWFNEIQNVQHEAIKSECLFVATKLVKRNAVAFLSFSSRHASSKMKKKKQEKTSMSFVRTVYQLINHQFSMVEGGKHWSRFFNDCKCTRLSWQCCCFFLRCFISPQAYRFGTSFNKKKSNRNLNLNNFCNMRSTTDIRRALFFWCMINKSCAN